MGDPLESGRDAAHEELAAPDGAIVAVAGPVEADAEDPHIERAVLRQH